MPIPTVKKAEVKELMPLHSFWEYQSALRVLAAYEAQIRSNKGIGNDRHEYVELLERIELFEETNKIERK